jgi:hypothetical protein
MLHEANYGLNTALCRRQCWKGSSFQGKPPTKRPAVLAAPRVEARCRAAPAERLIAVVSRALLLGEPYAPASGAVKLPGVAASACSVTGDTSSSRGASSRGPDSWDHSCSARMSHARRGAACRPHRSGSEVVASAGGQLEALVQGSVCWSRE